MTISVNRSSVWLGRIFAMLVAVMLFTVPVQAQALLDATWVEPAVVALRSDALLAPTPIVQPGPAAATLASSPSFIALQVSFAALEAMDVYSTIRGLNAGLAEANPLVRGAAHHPVGLTAVKGAAAASSLLLINRVARKSRTTAVVTLVAMNVAYAVVVARNLREINAR